MSSYSSQSMTSLTHLVNAVNAWSGPALTQYGAERVELGGPVAGRWLAKIAHYLTNDLAADLFGTGSPMDLAKVSIVTTDDDVAALVAMLIRVVSLH